LAFTSCWCLDRVWRFQVQELWCAFKYFFYGVFDEEPLLHKMGA